MSEATRAILDHFKGELSTVENPAGGVDIKLGDAVVGNVYDDNLAEMLVLSLDGLELALTIIHEAQLMGQRNGTPPDIIDKSHRLIDRFEKRLQGGNEDEARDSERERATDVGDLPPR